MINEFYLGAHMDYDKMRIAVGRTIIQLNNKDTVKLRSICNEQWDIKKTVNGERLKFYLLTENEFNDLTTGPQRTLNALRYGFDPVAYINKNKIDEVHDLIGSQYPQRMDYDEYEQYKNEMKIGLADCLVKVSAEII